MQNDEMLTIKDIAVMLKVGEKTIYSMAQSGELLASVQALRSDLRF